MGKVAWATFGKRRIYFRNSPKHKRLEARERSCGGKLLMTFDNHTPLSKVEDFKLSLCQRAGSKAELLGPAI